MPLIDFRLSVARHLLQKHQYRIDRRHVAPTSDLPLRLHLLQKHQYRIDRRHVAPTSDLPLRLYERNTFPEKIKIPKNSEFGGRRLCEVCRARGQKSKTQFCCKTCKTPLHPHPCMELYHTKQDYSK